MSLSPLIRVAAVSTLLLAAASAWAIDLTPHKAEYKVKISIVSGQLNTRLQATETGYRADSLVKAVGLSRLLTGGTMKIASEFTISPNGVMPVSFHEVDTVRNDPEVLLDFDWTNNTASGTVGKDEVFIQLEGLSHDNASIQYALMYDLLNDQTKETYVLFDINKMRVAHITNIGSKNVKTKAGRFDVVGIQHQKEGSSRVTTLWCAPELDYLPVIIEQHRKKKLNFRASLTKYTPLTEQASAE